MGQHWGVLKDRKYADFTPCGAQRLALGCVGKLYCGMPGREGGGRLVKPTDITSRTHLNTHTQQKHPGYFTHIVSKQISEHTRDNQQNLLVRGDTPTNQQLTSQKSTHPTFTTCLSAHLLFYRLCRHRGQMEVKNQR